MIFLDSLRKLRIRRFAPAMKPTTYYVPVVSAFPSRTAPLCPECAGPLTRASGCISCIYCGWGQCG